MKAKLNKGNKGSKIIIVNMLILTFSDTVHKILINITHFVYKILCNRWFNFNIRKNLLNKINQVLRASNCAIFNVVYTTDQNTN